MSHVAKEMQRQEFHVPLLIGGATTSRAHTALKIEPHYKSPTVWVKSRLARGAGGVASRSALISRELVDEFLARVRAEYAEIRERHKDRSGAKKLVTLEKARAQRFNGDWASYVPPQPNRPGITVFDDYPIAELVERIDWTPFFNAWELSGRYPAILKDAVVGAQASELYRYAREMLDRIVGEKWLTARGVIGFWRATSVGDDVELVSLLPLAGEGGASAPDEGSPGEPRPSLTPTPLPQAGEGLKTKLHFLRQQADKPAERPDFCLADFIAPKSSGVADWIGAFAVTAGIGIEPHLARFEREHDDYSSILLKALADRLAEAFAERLHQRVRREFWGYAPDESLDNDALIGEKYRGVRPAPGYPACPDHTEKSTLFRLLDATRNTGLELTDGFAMRRPCPDGISSHPGSQYFVVGRLTKEQVADYAKRKGWSLAEAERWLAPNLDYDPE